LEDTRPRRLEAGTSGFEDMAKARPPEPGPLVPGPVFRRLESETPERALRTRTELVQPEALQLWRRTVAEAGRSCTAVPGDPSGHMAELVLELEEGFLAEGQQVGPQEAEQDP
jgi:hypothetical protein